MSRRDGDGDVQPVSALRPNSFPERSWGAVRRAPQQKPELRPISEAIHVVGKLHTDRTRGTEGPARQSERLACLGELVGLKVDKVTLWAKEGNRQGEKPAEDKSGAFLSDILLSKWGSDANTQTPHIAVGCCLFVLFSSLLILDF